MRKLAIFVISLLVSYSVFADTEIRNWAVKLAPGELYFQEWVLVTGGSYSITNDTTYMWYPSKIETWYTSSTTSTQSVDYVFKHVNEQIYTNQVVTNEFGNIQTNWYHSITGSVNTYVTNTISTWTNTGTRAFAVPSELTDQYLGRGDFLNFNFGLTNAVWLRLIGRR